MRIFSLLTVVGLVSGGQIPLTPSPSLPSEPRPNLLNSDEFSVLTHKDHPNHKISLKAHDPSDAVCNGATKGFSGYLSIGDWKHFYFYYFESRKAPATDPLIMWINGGPGCSSMTGLFMELGPCRVNEAGNSTDPNPASWIEEASVFFLDQPIGVGFSYADKGHGIEANGTFAAAEDVFAFMQIWYQTFPESRALPYHIAGESYGGHYIPIFAKHILDENAKIAPEKQVPLRSVMIGNGIYDEAHQATSSWDISCTNVTGIGPLLKDDICKEMSKHVTRCERLWKAAYEYQDNLIGEVATKFCAQKFMQPFVESGLNFYDVSKPCEGELCYPIESSITAYLNSASIREALGIPEDFRKFHACSSKVGNSYAKVGDFYYPTTGEVAALLNQGLRVLMYVGTYDWICNFVGNERFLDALEWSGSYGYRHASRYLQQEWIGGLTWEFENLRYVRVSAAGHMVPYDKPEEALRMVQTWLNNEKL